MSPDLKKINASLKSRQKRSHQSVSREQIECAKLGKEVAKLTAQVKQLAAKSAELKRQTAELGAGRPVSVAKPAPALDQETLKRRLP
jgi:predicted RNase H-like nuclease (RuvC/YqgF family)